MEPLDGWVDLSNEEGMKAAPFPYHVSLGYAQSVWLSKAELDILNSLNGVQTVFPVASISWGWVAYLDPTHEILQLPVIQKMHKTDWHKHLSVSM